MTLFLLSIWCIDREFIDAVYSIRQLSLIIHWRFQGLLLLCFRRRFLDQPWHNVFYNSRCPPWLYFCYRFDALVVSWVMVPIPYVGCHSVFIDDFKVYSDSIFAEDLWISRDITFLTIPCTSHCYIFAIDLMCWSWIHWLCWLHMSIVTHYSLTFSSSTGTMFWLTIYGSASKLCFWQLHESAMTLFVLLIWCVGREFIDVFHSIWQLSLSIHWQFQGYSDSVFADNLRISGDIAFLTIPCVSREFLDAADYICRLHPVFVDDFNVYSVSVFADDLWIRRQISILTITCVSHDSIFAIDLKHCSWIQWRCWFNTSPVTQYLLTITRTTVTLFSLTIYRSAMT